MGFAPVEPKEHHIPDGRWQLITEWDSENFVSTVRLATDPLMKSADSLLSLFGFVNHDQPYETLVMADGKWLQESMIGSSSREEARKVHKRMVEQFIEGKFHKRRDA